MKTILLFFVMLTCFAGCEVRKPVHNFKSGEIVTIKITGEKAMVTTLTNQDGLYWVRTPQTFKEQCFAEYELEKYEDVKQVEKP